MDVLTLRIVRSAYQALREHSLAEFPNECCGVLLGSLDLSGRLLTAAVACRNVSAESHRSRYEISPKELVQVQRAARDRNEEILGFYHSHPNHPALWSPTDLEQAYWFGFSYVITSVAPGPILGETAAYLLDGTGESDKVFRPEIIEIVD
jgi:proteasome lid subunit RPN8/RPN11